jgi:hypothetical protein
MGKMPAEGYPARSGQAMFTVDGKFTAGTFDAADGLIPGLYMLNLHCFESTGADISKRRQPRAAQVPARRNQRLGSRRPADDAEPVVVELDVPA